ncbi:GNAT family N-acetyltransferase [candidate division GN15 bacterium]|nr:GNAT family N-acetyltransferase [candidate division GN15 bacterium]
MQAPTFTRNKAALASHFQRDWVLFAYHLGDLDDFYFPHCRWLVWPAADDVKEALLIYRPPGENSPSTVMAFGLSEAMDELLVAVRDQLPDRFFCHFQSHHRESLGSGFTLSPLGPHIKMRLDDLTRVNDDTFEQVVWLGGEDEGRIQCLMDRGYPDGYFSPHMLATGLYVGIEDGDKLVSLAGVHTHNTEQRIAVLGNIVTHPDYRGRGFATKVTYALSRRLAEQGLRVCLNVARDNQAARACYRSLGFVHTHDYEEGEFYR